MFKTLSLMLLMKTTQALGYSDMHVNPGSVLLLAHDLRQLSL